jgi:hypothetical protein
MPSTSPLGFPYPASSDPPNGPAQFQSLADSINAALTGGPLVVRRYTTTGAQTWTKPTTGRFLGVWARVTGGGGGSGAAAATTSTEYSPGAGGGGGGTVEVWIPASALAATETVTVGAGGAGGTGGAGGSAGAVSSVGGHVTAPAGGGGNAAGAGGDRGGGGDVDRLFGVGWRRGVDVHRDRDPAVGVPGHGRHERSAPVGFDGVLGERGAGGVGRHDRVGPVDDGGGGGGGGPGWWGCGCCESGDEYGAGWFGGGARRGCPGRILRLITVG